MFAKDFITGLILMAVIFLMLITVLDQKQIKNKLKLKVMMGNVIFFIMCIIVGTICAIVDKNNGG